MHWKVSGFCPGRRSRYQEVLGLVVDYGDKRLDLESSRSDRFTFQRSSTILSIGVYMELFFGILTSLELTKVTKRCVYVFSRDQLLAKVIFDNFPQNSSRRDNECGWPLVSRRSVNSDTASGN